MNDLMLGNVTRSVLLTILFPSPIEPFTFLSSLAYFFKCVLWLLGLIVLTKPPFGHFCVWR